MSENKCLQANSIPVPVHLATSLKDTLKYLASDAAIFVQQIHFWQAQGYGVLHEGRRWIYNRYKDWLAQLPWLTDYAFRKIKAVLLGMKIIQAKAIALALAKRQRSEADRRQALAVRRCNACPQGGIADYGRDRTLCYAINYDHELIKDFLHHNSTDGGDDQATVPPDDCPPNNTKTSSETSSKTANSVVAQPTDEQIEEACREIRGLSQSLQTNATVKSTLTGSWHNFRATVKYLKKAIRTWNVRSDFNWTGLLVKTLKSGVPDDEQNGCTRRVPFNPPSIEQMQQLEEMKASRAIRAIFTQQWGDGEAVVVDLWGKVVPWWEALAP